MSIVLFRVDERLIHGQVLMGWGRHLHPGRYVVVDDALAESGWEQDLYRLSVGGSSEVVFLSVTDARAQLEALNGDEVRTVLLTRDVQHMERLARGGTLRGEEVNLGGLHHRAGKDEVRSYIHLDDADRDALRAMDDAGVTVTGRDLPETSRVPLSALLE